MYDKLMTLPGAKISLFLLIIMMINILRQESPAQENSKFHLSPGINYQGKVAGELCAIYGRVEKDHNIPALSGGLRFGSEISVVNGKLLMGPKVGYEACLVFLGLRESFVYYVLPAHSPDFRFVSEIGLSIFTRANIFYGYSVPVAYKIEEIGQHRITLSVNLWRFD